MATKYYQILNEKTPILTFYDNGDWPIPCRKQTIKQKVFESWALQVYMMGYVFENPDDSIMIGYLSDF